MIVAFTGCYDSTALKPSRNVTIVKNLIDDSSNAPNITSVNISKNKIAPNETINLTVNAIDPDNGNLSYAWTSSDPGSYSNPSSLSTTWTAPNNEGIYNLTITVIDEDNFIDKHSFDIDVKNEYGLGIMPITIGVNNYPEISSIIADPTSLKPGETTSLFITASDPEGDPLSYLWTSTCGSFNDASISSPQFTVASSANIGDCTLKVQVSDGSLTTQGSVTTQVLNNTKSNIGPEIISYFQSANRTGPGESVILIIKARDVEGKALRFTWNSPVGTFSDESITDVTNGYVGRITWTALRTCRQKVNITADVVNDKGIINTVTFMTIDSQYNEEICRPPAWQLEVTTTAPGQKMTIGLENPVNILVYWDDGNQETTNSTSITHTYAKAGVYTLEISGQASRIHFDNPHGQGRLTGILSVVKGISGITSFESTFNLCQNLKGPIPPGLFDNTPQVTTFRNVFKNCSKLSGSIPPDLFIHNTQVTDFHGAFRLCIRLTGSIPPDLFANNTQVVSFRYIFGGCSGLTGSIPSGLFNNNPLVTNMGHAFGSCSGLTGPIPPGLFDNNPLVEDFDYTFYMASGLRSIPNNLFANNIYAKNFKETFFRAYKLAKIPLDIFDNNPLIINLERTFRSCCTGSTDRVPKLWNSFPEALHSGCFAGLEKASNWRRIPVDWKEN